MSKVKLMKSIDIFCMYDIIYSISNHIMLGE